MTSILAFGYGPSVRAGMGIVLSELLPRLQTMGYDVTWIAKGGGPDEYEGINVVPEPPVQSAHARQLLSNVLHKEEPDIFFTNLNWQGIQNIQQVLNPYYQNAGEHVDVILHTPIESPEAPPGFQERIIDDHLNPVHLLPFTEPSMEMFPDEFNAKAWCKDWVPHGVGSTFREPPARAGFVKHYGGNDPLWVVINAGNERRKNLDRWIRTAAKIKERFDGDVRFAMHTSPEPKRGDPLWGGWELPRLAQAEGLEPQEDIIWTKEHAMQAVPAEQIDAMYGDADLYMSLSGGEGFGLPVAEAMVRETACLLTDHMNHEFVAGAGARYVDVEDWTYMRTGEKILLPDPDEAADKAVGLLEDEGAREDLAANGADHAEQWRWETAIQRMIDYIEEER